MLWTFKWSFWAVLFFRPIMNDVDCSLTGTIQLIKLIFKDNFHLPLLHHFLPLITTSLPSLVIWHSMFVASEDATSGSETKKIEDNVQSHKNNVRLSFLLGTCCNLLCNAYLLSCVNEEVLMHARQGGRLVSSSLACTALTSKSYF